MSFAETLIYAVDTLSSLAGNRLAQAGAAALILALGLTFALGDFGARLRAGTVRLGIFALIGATGTLAVIAYKGAPETETAQAPQPQSSERRVEAWIERQQRQAAAARELPQSPAESKAAEAARKRLIDYATARRALEREREEIGGTPEAKRTPDQHRRDAKAVVGLANIDRAEGRLKNALRRYREAQKLFGRIADPEARRAGVEVKLEAASALEAQRDPGGARAAYASAISEQRGLVELPERERRGGLASALLQYAKFEINQREEKPARAALDEAGEHYAFLRALRGRFEVAKSRAGLLIAVGNFEAARDEIEMLRKLLAEPGLAGAAPAVDLVEGRLMAADGRDAEADALFRRAVTALRRAVAGRPEPDRMSQENLAATLLAQSELRFQYRDLAAARSLAGEAVAIWRLLDQRVRIVDALVHWAVWEAAAGDPNAAERALAAAQAARRDLGELRTDAEIEGAIKLLCLGALRSSPTCRLMANIP